MQVGSEWIVNRSVAFPLYYSFLKFLGKPLVDATFNITLATWFLLAWTMRKGLVGFFD